MTSSETPLPGVILVETSRFGDDRGYFTESFHAGKYSAVGIPGPFVQDNVSFSARGVLRGLHYQWPNPQGKLVMCLSGEIFDVAVDIRPDSDTYLRWHGEVLSFENGRQLYIPEGFAHGFCVLSETALVAYKCTSLYNGAADCSIRFDDPDIGIEWPIESPLLSPKDAKALTIASLDREALPSLTRMARASSA